MQEGLYYIFISYPKTTKGHGMAYRTATEGQIVFYDNGRYDGRNVCREKVVFKSYYRSHDDLVKPNRAVIVKSTDGGDIPLHVDVVQLYKTNCKCEWH